MVENGEERTSAFARKLATSLVPLTWRRRTLPLMIYRRFPPMPRPGRGEAIFDDLVEDNEEAMEQPGSRLSCTALLITSRPLDMVKQFRLLHCMPRRLLLANLIHTIGP